MSDFSLVKRCSSCGKAKAVFNVDMGGFTKLFCAECYQFVIERNKKPILENELTRKLRKILKELDDKFGREELQKIMDYTMKKYKEW